MRYRAFVRLMSILAFIVVCDVQLSDANMVMLHEGYQNFVWNIGIIVAVFCATVVVEYIIIWLLLGRPVAAGRVLFFWVFLVNLITNPAAQASFLYFPAFPIIISFDWAETIFSGLCAELLVIELLVMAVEYLLLRWAFRSMCYSGKLNGPVTAKQTLKIAVLANLGSLMLGFSILVFWKLTWMLEFVY